VSETPSTVRLADGPVTVYLYAATSKEILEALERLLPQIRMAAINEQRKLDGPQR